MNTNLFAHLVLKVYVVQPATKADAILSKEGIVGTSSFIGTEQPKKFKEGDKEAYLVYLGRIPANDIMIICGQKVIHIDTREARNNFAYFQGYMHTVGKVWDDLWKEVKDATRVAMN